MSYLSNESAVHLDRASEITTGDKERIANILRLVEGHWVCGSAFLECMMPTYSQRISEMIREERTPIERGMCDNPNHRHRSRMGAYRWTPSDAGIQSALTM